jgi:O-antigen ligase
VRHWAQPLSEGWRASATIGYANVTALLLLGGLLCACSLASVSARASDKIRCWVLAVGLFATQSRSAVVAMLVCGLILVVCCRAMAKVLFLSGAWALVAFAGLLPAIRGWSLGGLSALAAAGLSLALLRRTHHLMLSWTARSAAAVALPVMAALAGTVILQSRILDQSSTQGRIELWRGALIRVRSAGIFGEGPHQLADLSRGKTIVLLVHNDYLQYAEYYGLLGLVGVAVIGCRWALQLVRTRATVEDELWATALTISVAVAIVAFVDFPLQVPVVPAMASLAFGSAIRPGHQRRRVPMAVTSGPS